MGLSDDLGRIAASASRFADESEKVTGVLAAEPSEGERVYLCAFEEDGGRRTWLALDSAGRPVEERIVVRDSVSILGLCEVAEETAGGGDLDDLRARLVSLRLTEAPPGIEHAEEAVLDLQRAIGVPPRIASVARLDQVGSATRRLEEALGEGGSPFAEAMKMATRSIEVLADEVEANYKLELS